MLTDLPPETKLLSIEGLDIFGRRQFKNSTVETHKGVFNGITFSTFNPSDRLRETCIKILNGETQNTNRLLIDRLVFTVTDTDSTLLTKILLDAFDITSKQFSVWIQSQIDADKFLLKLFLEKYQHYYNNTTLLKNLLKYYDSNMFSNQDQKSKYSYIILMKNIALFSNVVNRKYHYATTQSLYLYEIFSKFLTDQTNMDDVLSLFKIYQFYNKLLNMTVVTASDRTKFLKNELDNKFVLSGSPISNKLITTLMNNVNDLVKQLSREKDMDLAKKLLNYIRDVLLMGINIGDKSMFLLLYRSFLTERLTKYQSDPLVEFELLKMFLSYKEDPDLYAKMKFQIYDAMSSKQHEELYKNLKVELRSERFAKWNLKTINRNACKLLIMRQYAWDTKELDQYNVPNHVGIYQAILSSYFLNRLPDMKLTISHNTSTGDLKMKLSKDEEYIIQMTLPQMYVVLTICEQGPLTAKDIGKALNVPLPKLVHTFNSLIDVNLMLRSKGLPNDPNILFSINWDLSFQSKKVSIVAAVKKSKDMMETKQKEKKATVGGVSTSMLRAKLLSVAMNNKKLTFAELKAELVKEMNAGEIPETMIQDEVKHAVMSNYLTQEGDEYVYKAKTGTPIDDSDDDEKYPPPPFSEKVEESTPPAPTPNVVSAAATP